VPAQAGAVPANVASTLVMAKLGLRFEREGETDHGPAVGYVAESGPR
jgi:hypothetical protein